MFGQKALYPYHIQDWYAFGNTDNQLNTSISSLHNSIGCKAGRNIDDSYNFV